MSTSGWIGVDFDKTLAFFDGGYTAGRLGKPIPKMMDRVKAWIQRGIEVRIVTARACDPDECVKVQDWLERQGLPRLKVTNMKDFAMIELWDDAAITVVRNTGERCCDYRREPSRKDGLDTQLREEDPVSETIVELMDEHAFMPARNREGDAGLDVRSPCEVMLEPGKVARVGLGFRLQLPVDHCALVIERSGHAFKHGIKSVGPLIDPNYRGEVHAQLHNSSEGLVHFSKGDRICQLLIFKFNQSELRPGKVDQDTVRGPNGMGSSGDK